MEKHYGAEGAAPAPPRIRDAAVVALPHVARAVQQRAQSAQAAVTALRRLAEAEALLQFATRFSSVAEALSVGAVLPSVELFADLWEDLQHLAPEHPARALEEDVGSWFLEVACPTLAVAESFCRGAHSECRTYLEALGVAQRLLETVVSARGGAESRGEGQAQNVARMLREAVIEAGAAFVSYKFSAKNTGPGPAAVS